MGLVYLYLYLYVVYVKGGCYHSNRAPENLATPLSEDGQEEGAEQNIWLYDGRTDRRLDRTVLGGAT